MIRNANGLAVLSVSVFPKYLTGPCGGVPSVEVTRFQSLALLAQSRVLARLISESRTVLSSSTR